MNAKLTLVSTCLLVLSLATPSARSANAGVQTPQLLAQNQYPQSLRDDYMSSCKRRATGEGLNQAQAQRLCECTLRRFQARFSSAQFIALNRRASQTGQTPQAFTDIGMACYRELRNSN